MATKITTDMIKPFNGEGDFVSWLQKVKLVAKLSKVTELHNFIPLYLEGDALAVYMGMSEKNQEDAAKIEERLTEAFTDGPFVAWGKLSSYKWSGESVDIYANELRRLAGLAGFESPGLETVVKLAFIGGFPNSISVELQQIAGVQSMLMSKLLPRARILAASGSTQYNTGAVAMSNKRGVQGEKNDSQSRRDGSGEGRGFKGKCFRCDGPHMARFCPQKKPIVCYKCGEEGHISVRCSSGSGNE